MQKSLIAPLRLTFTQSDAGAMATSQLNIDLKGKKLRIQNSIEAEGSNETTTVGTLDSINDWRFVISLIEMQDEYAYFLHDETVPSTAQLLPQDIMLVGIANHATELIAYAWAGATFLEIAQALSMASDEQLIELRESVGLGPRLLFSKS